MDKLSATVEDYLILIFVLERDNEPIVGVHLAELLGVTPPTVTNTLKRTDARSLDYHGCKRHALDKSRSRIGTNHDAPTYAHGMDDGEKTPLVETASGSS